MPRRDSEERENIAQLREQVKNETSLTGMLGSLAASLQTGAPIPKSSSSSKGRAVGSVLQPEDHHIDPSTLSNAMGGTVRHSDNQQGSFRFGQNAWGQSLLVNDQTPHHPQNSHPMQRQASSQLDMGDLTPVIADILSFPFSENRTSEIKQIQSALKSEMTKICAKRVVANTQSNVKCAKQFYLGKSGSLRTEFSILGQKYSMLVEGSFQGDEILYPTVEGDEVVGLVMRETPSGLDNATDNFKVTISKGWKE